MIYVASSWRNQHYGGILEALTQWALPFYNWRDQDGFHWSEVMEKEEHVEHWTEPIPTAQFTAALKHPRAGEGFRRDMRHLVSATAVILLLPCGRSAHLEAGWAVGADRPLAIYLPEPVQPELMYNMANLVTDDIDELLKWTNSEHLRRTR